MAKIDWVQAQKDYIENPTLSYADIAKKYGVTEGTVERRGAVEKWGIRRENVGEKTIQKVEAELVDRNSEINERHSRHYRNMQAMAGNLLVIANNTIQKKLEEKGVDNVTIYEEGMISPSRVKFLFEALKVAIDGERVTVGLPTSVERKEVTGKDGSDLFAKVDEDKLYNLLDATVKALAERPTSPEHRGTESPSTGESQ